MKASIQDDRLSVVYGRKTINFSLLYCDRKTMEIAVLPDSTVVVKARKRWPVRIFNAPIPWPSAVEWRDDAVSRVSGVAWRL